MENLNIEYAEPSSFALWIKLGLAAIAVGWLVAGLGQLFWEDGMNTIGNFLRRPGGVLLTAGIIVAGMKADELSDGVRMSAIICGGLLACVTLV
ncbi:MAG: hypothetical protein ACI9WU_000262 [Myxococcota bacterium]|jgi:hypothetical protein